MAASPGRYGRDNFDLLLENVPYQVTDLKIMYLEKPEGFDYSLYSHVCSDNLCAKEPG